VAAGVVALTTGYVMLHTPSVDVSDDGPKLDQEWTEADNNVCGIVRGCRDASYEAYAPLMHSVRVVALAGPSETPQRPRPPWTRP